MIPLIVNWGGEVKKVCDAGLFPCPHCQGVVGAEVWRTAKAAGVYYLNLVKWSKQYWFVCPVCQAGAPLTHAEFERIKQEQRSRPSNSQALDLFGWLTHEFETWAEESPLTADTIGQWVEQAKGRLRGRGHRLSHVEHVVGVWVGVHWEVLEPFLHVAGPEPDGPPDEATIREHLAALGLAAAEVTPDAVKAAYRQAVRRDHPDLQRDKGSKVQKAAHQRMVRINRAYQAVSKWAADHPAPAAPPADRRKAEPTPPSPPPAAPAKPPAAKAPEDRPKAAAETRTAPRAPSATSAPAGPAKPAQPTASPSTPRQPLGQKARSTRFPAAVTAAIGFSILGLVVLFACLATWTNPTSHNTNVEPKESRRPTAARSYDETDAHASPLGPTNRARAGIERTPAGLPTPDLPPPASVRAPRRDAHPRSVGPADSGLEDAHTYVRTGVLLDEAGQHAEAIRAYQKALTLSPNDASVYWLMGLSYERLGRRADAITVYRWALQVAPKHALARHSLSRLLEDR